MKGVIGSSMGPCLPRMAGNFLTGVGNVPSQAT
jgi:hypothetical protein